MEQPKNLQKVGVGKKSFLKCSICIPRSLLIPSSHQKQRENRCCKISGYITEIEQNQWEKRDFIYVGEVFGKCMGTMF